MKEQIYDSLFFKVPPWRNHEPRIWRTTVSHCVRGETVMRKHATAAAQRSKKVVKRMTTTTTLEYIVGYDTLDCYHHVNFSVYLRWIGDAQWHFMDTLGIGYKALQEDYGLKIFARRVEVDYLGQLFPDDKIIIETKLAKIGRTSTIYEQQILKDNNPVLRSKIVSVYVDEHGKSTLIPDEIRKKLETIL